MATKNKPQPGRVRGEDAGAQFLHLMLENAFRGRGWQGATLVGALRGVSAAQALKPPAKGRRCIWEHVLHAAYWKYAVRSILERSPTLDPALVGVTPPETDGFARSPSNWPRVPNSPDDRQWKSDKALLVAEHERLLELACDVPIDLMGEHPSPSHKWSLGTYIAGVAAHDCYHLGQIQLIKRLIRA